MFNSDRKFLSLNLRSSKPSAGTSLPYEPFTDSRILYLFVAHLLLGLVVRFIPIVGTAHALVCGIVAVRATFHGGSQERMLLMVMYLLGSSLLWRVGQAGVLWFFPEYLSAMIILFGLWRLPTQRAGIGMIFLFLLFLLPSVPLTIFGTDIVHAQGQIAYIMIPLMLLTLAIYTVSKFELSVEFLRDMALVSVLPITANWALAGFNVYIVGVEYGTTSNDFAAGGMAANQVSNAFSYAAAVLILSALLPGKGKRLRYIYFAGAAVFLIQSILTFSRGGVINLLVFIALTVPFFLQARGQRIRFIVVFGVLAYVFNTYVIPDLDVFTEGALERRYEKEGTTGRDYLMEQDLDIFMDNPITGVGPGLARELRHYGRLQGVNAHTEYSRILAEHGVFGAIALLVLAYVFLRIFRAANTSWQRGLVAGCIGWLLTILAHSATRIPMFILMAIMATGIAHIHETTTGNRRGET